MSTNARDEINTGDRFAFGENWRQFLELVDDSRIEAAVASVRAALDVETLDGKRFVDVGSGSGLFSLAARRLGAEVTSFDFDPDSVACTRELRRRYDSEEHWRVEQGSALDRVFIGSLGSFDVVYSFGVLHHTGDLWDALDAVTGLVGARGLLYLSLYNDQGRASKTWARVKKAYNDAGPRGRKMVVAAADAYFQARALAGRTLNQITGQAPPPKRGRGMDRRRDLIDWVGGWPFEVSRPEQVFDFYRAQGFELRRLKTAGGGLGTNEYLFVRH